VLCKQGVAGSNPVTSTKFLWGCAIATPLCQVLSENKSARSSANCYNTYNDYVVPSEVL
jgi:hypothetical protein